MISLSHPLGILLVSRESSPSHPSIYYSIDNIYFKMFNYDNVRMRITSMWMIPLNERHVSIKQIRKMY
jgi:hypothetical protein